MCTNWLSIVVLAVTLYGSPGLGSFCNVTDSITHSLYGQNVTFNWSVNETARASRWKMNNVTMMGWRSNFNVTYEGNLTADKVWPIDDTAFILARTSTEDSALYTCEHIQAISSINFVLVAQSQLQVHTVSVDNLLPNLLLNGTEMDSDVSVDSRNNQTLSSSVPMNDPACVNVLINVVGLDHRECSHLSSAPCSLVLGKESMLHRYTVNVSVILFHPLVGTKQIIRMLHTHATPAVAKDLPTVFNVSTEGNLNLSCIFSARPDVTVVWMYTNGSALPGDIYSITEFVSGDALKITTSKLQWNPTTDHIARIGQGGWIQCISENEHGNLTSGAMNLNVQYGPHDIGINSTENKFNFIEGDIFTPLACVANCNPTCKYSWHWANGTVVAMDNTLTFEPFNRMYHGQFHCRATNEIDSDGITFTVIIEVFYGPSIHSFAVSPPNDPISQNDDITFTCHTGSRPMPVITLIRPSGDKLVSSSTSNTLVHTLTDIDCLDSGSYRCEAYNTRTGNTSYMTKSVVVHCPPRVHTSSPTDVSPSEGDTVNLTLTAIGFPKPEFTWYFNGTEVSGPSPGVTSRLTSEPDVYSSSSLILHNVTQQDFGNYSVEAVNDEGSMNVDFMLTSVGAPRNPTQLKANHTNSVSITMQWTSGWNRGGEQMFTLMYRRSNSDDSYSNTTSISDPGQEKEAMKKVTGLSANSSYDFTVLATNEYGTSMTAVTAASTADKPDLGSNSDGSFSILITGGMATITWSLYTYRGPITHVVVTSCVSDSTNCINKTVPPATSKVDVSVPEGGSSYTFEFLVYDGEDLLLNVKHNARVDNGSPVRIIVGVLVGVVLFVVAAIVGFLLWRRKAHAGIGKDKIPASDLGHVNHVMVTDDDIPLTANGKHDTMSEGHQMVVENTLYSSSGSGERDHMEQPYSEVPMAKSSAKGAGKKKPKGRKGKRNAVEMNNPHLESDSRKLPMEDTISPYEDVDGTDKPKGAGPVDSQLPMYAEVDCSQKQKKRRKSSGSMAPELAAYADVNDVKKNKHAKKAMNSHINEPEVVEYEEVDFKKKSPAAAAGGGVAMGAAALPEYGQVDLSKKHKQGKAAKPPQLEEYAQVDFSKKNKKGKKTKPGAPPPRPPRAASVDEGERAQSPPHHQPQYGIEGTLYADLDLINTTPTRTEPTVHANLEPSEYASIDAFRLTTRPADQ